jgi:hypothetical protein
VSLLTGEALAQQKQRVSYMTTAENSKYTQQHVLDVGDVPGHQVRLYEIHRTFPNNAPVINGMKLKETWTRSVSDYVDGNGTSPGYNVYVLENGDKFFARSFTVSQSAGGGKNSATTVSQITGGTGKLVGVQGTVRSSSIAQPTAGVIETQTEIEFWIAN